MVKKSVKRKSPKKRKSPVKSGARKKPAARSRTAKKTAKRSKRFSEEPDAGHIVCAGPDNRTTFKARVSGAGWKISANGQDEKFFPRLDYFDWQTGTAAQAVWNGNAFDVYYPPFPSSPISHDYLAYVGVTIYPNGHAKRWIATYNKKTNIFNQSLQQE
jgi:hypothetical protein